jgi:hypothetical protein
MQALADFLQRVASVLGLSLRSQHFNFLKPMQGHIGRGPNDYLDRLRVLRRAIDGGLNRGHHCARERRIWQNQIMPLVRSTEAHCVQHNAIVNPVDCPGAYR